jgi:hypothetical protein
MPTCRNLPRRRTDRTSHRRQAAARVEAQARRQTADRVTRFCAHEERAQKHAQFVIDTAIEQSVHIAIVGNPHDPSVFVWAPTAPTIEQQLSCEHSFKQATYRNLQAIRRYASKPGGRR